MGLRRNGANALEVVRGQGPGSLYYSTHLTLFEVVEGVEAASRGFTLHRQYCVPTEDASPDEPCQPPPVLQPGDRVEVRLTLVVPEPRHYVVLEDFFPAGTEALDPTLATEPQGEGGPEVHVEDGWWAPFDHRELRDERAVFFADELAPGTYHVRYRLRATLPGAYRVLPATVSETYFPEVWGRTEGGTMEILSENE
jgi:hypothetical protein